VLGTKVDLLRDGLRCVVLAGLGMRWTVRQMLVPSPPGMCRQPPPALRLAVDMREPLRLDLMVE